jgi:flagellar basal body-associated protein FliL
MISPKRRKVVDNTLVIVGIVLLVVALGGGGWLYRKGWTRGKAKENETAKAAAEAAVAEAMKTKA